MKEDTKSDIISLAISTLSAIIGAIIFLLVYDAILDRVQGKSDSVTKAFVSKLKTLPIVFLTLSGSEEREIYYEINGNEVLIDLRSLCKPNNVKSSESGLLISCNKGNLKIPISCQPLNWNYNNGILVIACKERPKIESGEGT